MSIAFIFVGLALLAWASEHFVMGAARLAAALRVSSIVIGAVVVGFGTSLPEALVSGLAALRDEPDLGVGNIVGSNVANLSLLLGVAAVVLPLSVTSKTVWREAPLTVAALVAFALFVQTGFALWEGVVFLVVLGAALAVLFRGARGPDVLGAEIEAELGPGPDVAVVEGVRTVLGLAGTLVGAELLVRGAVDIAERFDLTGGLVGLTIVAVGTSLPELVTVIQSARHNEPDLVLGNLLGSCVFNCLFVGAVVAFLAPGTINDGSLTVTGPLIGVGLAALVWVMLRTGHRLTRGEGAALITVYGGFLVAVA